jgi:uncharacterized protein (TIGR01777 family)
VVAKRVVIAGGSGFIGRRLVRRLLARKDLVTVLSRDPVASRESLPEGVRVAGYAPTEEGPWFDELAQTDALVSLAGEALGGVRWTPSRKKTFEASRITANEMLVRAIERTPEKHRPKVWIAASASGFYGAHGPDEEIDEASAAGRDYLALLAEKWEQAAARATSLGVRVVHARFGIVLGKGGGALAKMARPFRMHLGGSIGSGKQIIPWVHIDDVCGMVMMAIDKEDVKGPVNVASPNPVNMDELSEAIGVILNRRSYLRVPEGALRALYGEGADPLLTGQRMIPRVAIRLGYEFEYPELLPALESVLGPD